MLQKSASAYERHQSILQLLNELESVRVGDLAERLNVSESTIRTDLETLDSQGRLTRVRGGAVAVPAAERIASENYLSAKVSQNREEKSWIARWAASMVEDGDAIILDASSTVLHIAQYLLDRRELVVFTNGISVAQRLAAEPSNTVIVLGGILRPNGNAITGSISEATLRSYHIHRAFMSCSGFSPELGFFENDMQEAQMKALMMQATQQCVMLFDSTKVGRVGLTTFATLDEVDYVGVDVGVDRTTVSAIRDGGTHVVVCGEQTTRSYGPRGKVAETIRIGFANLSEHTPFSRDVRRGLEEAARAHGGIELVLADNQLDADVALSVADKLMADDLDLVIDYQVDEGAGNLIAHKFQKAGVPIIAVDIPMVGATYFGVDNYVAGKMAGLELGRAVRDDWDNDFDHLIVVEQRRTGSLPATRITGQVDGLEEILGPIPLDKIIAVDFDNTEESARRVVRATLAQIPLEERVAFVCFNDDAAVGALQVAREMGHIENMRLVGQGADRRLRAEMRHGTEALVGATAFCPETYGERLLELALDIFDGRQVPLAVYTDHFFVNAQNVDVHYPGDADENAGENEYAG